MRSRLALVAQWLFATAVVGSALAVGSIDIRVLAVVTLALTASVLGLWIDATPIILRRSARIALLVAIGLTAFTGLQVLPLPAGVVAALSPHAARIWATSLSPLHESGPRFATLSVDPPATKAELLRGLTYLLAYLGALQLARTRDGVRFLERTLLMSGTAVAIAALLNPALSPTSVFGLYHPRTDVTIVAPFLNVNNLAAYTALAAVVAFGSALSQRPAMPRPILGAIVIFLVATIVMRGSRGGLLGVFTGLGAALLVTILVRSRRVGAMPIALGFLSLVGVALAAFAVAPSASHLLDTDAAKVGVALQALRSMATAYPLTGAGRGAFEPAFPEFRSSGGGFVVYTHPENLIVEWVTEWGIVVFVVGFALLVFALSPRRLTRRRQAIAAWAAIVATFVHDQFDYSAEIPAMMLALTVCAAIVVGGDGAVPSRGAWALHRMRTIVAAAAVALAASGLALAERRHLLLDDEEHLRDLARSGSHGPSADRALRAAMLAHPAEPYFPYIGAVIASQTRTKAVMPWVERCLQRARIYPPAHRLLAGWLRKHGHLAQARLEYRISEEEEGPSAPDISAQVAALVANLDDALELAPPGATGIVLLDGISARLRFSRPATAWRIDEEILRRAPENVTANVRRAKALLDDSEHGAPWCSSSSPPCAQVALDAARKVQSAKPSSCEGYELEASARIVGGTPRPLEGLKAATDTVLDRSECLRQLAKLAARIDDEPTVAYAVDALIRAPCTTDAECRDNLLFAGSIEAGRGATAQALSLYERASERDPSSDSALELCGVEAVRSKRTDLARKAYTELAKRHPTNPEYAAALNGLHNH